MDSCVCAALAARDHTTAAVHVSYGQRTEQRERKSFLAICQRLNIHDKLIVRNEGRYAPLAALRLPMRAYSSPAPSRSEPAFLSPMSLFAMPIF